MASFFSGWVGYGTGFLASSLQEPSDTAYARRPIVFSMLENQVSFDVGSGTVGPAATAWGALTYGGLFNQYSGGSPLLVFPLLLPAVIVAGMTFTTGPGSNVLVGLGLNGGHGTQAIPSGTVIGYTPDGRPWTTAVAVQVTSGVLSAQTSSFGSSVTMASLPAQSPASGSGQLWNNGGLIAIA